MLRSIYALFTFCFVATSSSAYAATGSIGSNQPCTLANGASSCTVTVNYNYSGTPSGCVWLVDAAPTLVSCESVSPASFSWPFATLLGSHFELRAHSIYPTNNAAGNAAGTLLASHVAFARNSIVLPRPADLSGDGRSDLIYRNNSTGQINAWLMNGGTSTADAALVGPGNWTVSHTADFNGDGKADILFRNDDGSVTLWLMNGLNPISQIGLLGADPSWRVTHVGDFNGDGKADLLWQNTNGAVTIWLMNGSAVISAVGVLGANPEWSVTHVADFNSDGKADLLWRNTNGAVTMWLMNGTTIISAVGILGATADWRVTHTPDLNGDGKADLLWRNTDGSVTAWLMNGTSQISSAALLGANPDWSVSHTADFNGDGKSDLLWRNTNGAVTIWQMNGLTNIGAVGLLGADPNWRVTHIGDYNGDGRSDVVWRNAADGSITMWLIDGATVISRTTVVGAGPWVVAPNSFTLIGYYTYDQFMPLRQLRTGYFSSPPNGGVIPGVFWKTTPQSGTKTDVQWSAPDVNGFVNIEEHEVKSNCANNESYTWVNAYRNFNAQTNTNNRFKVSTTKALIIDASGTHDITSGGSCGTDGQPYARFKVDGSPYMIQVWGNIHNIDGSFANRFFWQARYTFAPSVANSCWQGTGSNVRPALKQEEVWWDAVGGWLRGTGNLATPTNGPFVGNAARPEPDATGLIMTGFSYLALNAGHLWQGGNTSTNEPAAYCLVKTE
jgi:FG-GAP-like repeat